MVGAGHRERASIGRAERSGASLLPIMSAVFIAFLVIGIAIPVLPLHVHQGLGQSTFLVGLVAGSQFAAAILSRVWAAGGPAPTRAYIAELLPDVIEGHIAPGRVFDRTVGLDGVPDGYRAMNEREAIKVMVKP